MFIQIFERESGCKIIKQNVPGGLFLSECFHMGHDTDHTLGHGVSSKPLISMFVYIIALQVSECGV